MLPGPAEKDVDCRKARADEPNVDFRGTCPQKACQLLFFSFFFFETAGNQKQEKKGDHKNSQERPHTPKQIKAHKVHRLVSRVSDRPEQDDQSGNARARGDATEAQHAPHFKAGAHRDAQVQNGGDGDNQHGGIGDNADYGVGDKDGKSVEAVGDAVLHVGRPKVADGAADVDLEKQHRDVVKDHGDHEKNGYKMGFAKVVKDAGDDEEQRDLCEIGREAVDDRVGV